MLEIIETKQKVLGTFVWQSVICKSVNIHSITQITGRGLCEGGRNLLNSLIIQRNINPNTSYGMKYPL